MALIDDIRRQVRREERLVNGMSEDFARELARVLRQTNRRVTTLLGQLEASGGRLVASQASLGRALRLRTELGAILEDAGFTALVADSLGEPLDRLTAEVLRGRSITARAARLTPLDLDILDAWRTIRTADLLDVGETAVTAVWRSTLDGVLANRSVDALAQEIGAVAEVSERQARTIYDTAASTYSRQVHQLGIDPEANDRFLYVGPNDSATRPFCQSFIGQVLTRRELDDVDNGQLPNTLLTGGGFNCRHMWFFLADLDASEVAA